MWLASDDKNVEQMVWEVSAVMAMVKMCAGDSAKMVAERDQTYDETNWPEVLSRNAYDFADVMVKERRKRIAAGEL